MSDPETPEFDRLEGTPHPRHTARLYGQASAEAAFLTAYNGGRLHHGWLITGPRGVGKATLAWRIARFLLAEAAPGAGLFAAPPPTSLDIPADHPVARRTAALSEPRLKLIRRDWDFEDKKNDTVITVKRIRELKSLFQMSAADGGRRVVIIDPADEMNLAASNALLKVLEEPPSRAVLLLISHQPLQLLPTIRSRCRELRCATLAPVDLALALAGAGTAAAPQDAVALAELSSGSVGEAYRLTNLEGLSLYRDLVALFATLPRLDRPRALRLTESAAGKANEQRFELILTLFDLFLARAARTGVLGPAPEAAPGEAALLQRLSPDAGAARTWADAQQRLGNRARTGKSVNLDPAMLLLDMVLQIDETATALAAR